MAFPEITWTNASRPSDHEVNSGSSVHISDVYVGKDFAVIFIEKRI